MLELSSFGSGYLPCTLIRISSNGDSNTENDLIFLNHKYFLIFLISGKNIPNTIVLRIASVALLPKSRSTLSFSD